MESKFDYITLTLKSKEKSFDEALSCIYDDLNLGDLIQKMTCKGRAGFYDYHFTYENIEFLFTDPVRFEKQGFCLKISSLGLDYFNKYLASYGLTLKKWLGRWRSLAFEGYITKATRFDYAMDDIVKKDGCPTMTMSHVIRAVNNNEVCKKARTVDILCGNEIAIRERHKYCDGEPIRGRTVYVGVRQSGTFVRFYDKLAEQIQRKQDIPKDVSHWTRCEVEFHDSDAMGVLNAFLDKSDDEFNEYMAGVVNNQCRFITKNNENVSRCPSKRWWKAFLNGCTSCFKLPHKKPARSALARAENGIRQHIRNIYSIIQVVGFEGFYKFYESEVEVMKVKNKEILKSEIIENLREDVRDYEEMDSVKYYAYNRESADDLEERARQQRSAYRYVVSDHNREFHALFMSGQEVMFA